MKAVIFDFNGTLFDDTRFHIEAWVRYMRRRFGREVEKDYVVTHFIGPSNSLIFRREFGDRLTEEELQTYSLEKEAEYRAVAREDPANLRLIDGAPELFDLLTARGIPFALATTSELPNVDFYRSDLDIERWFDPERIVYNEGKLPSKPDPALYIEAARRLGVDPADCIVCEDSLSGIEAAKRFGAGRIVAIDRTVPREALLADPGIYAVIHDYRGSERFLTR